MNFVMADSYSESSASQVSIGEKLVQVAVRASSELLHSDTISLIDLACGPGELTKRLFNQLEGQGFSVEHVGILDYDPSMLTQASRLLPDCNAYEQDFYMPLSDRQKYDVVFSNEGLHWIPSVSDIIPHLQGDTPPLLRASFSEKFSKWGNLLLVKSLSNLRGMSKEHGIAVLQFGREGQLDKLWSVVEEVLSELGVSSKFEGALFPLYYPDEESLFYCVRKSGYSLEEAHFFQENLFEETADDIVSFFKGFADPRLRMILSKEGVEEFYNMMLLKIQSMDINEFRKNQWNRSVLVLKNLGGAC